MKYFINVINRRMVDGPISHCDLETVSFVHSTEPIKCQFASLESRNAIVMILFFHYSTFSDETYVKIRKETDRLH